MNAERLPLLKNVLELRMDIIQEFRYKEFMKKFFCLHNILLVNAI